MIGETKLPKNKTELLRSILDQYRISGELPSPLTGHTFKLHWANAAQV